MENRKIKSRCIFISDDKILLCYNGEHDYYFFPGGSQDNGEKVEETLRREVLEEFGCNIENEKVLVTLKNVGRDSDETITMFKADFSNPNLYKKSEIPLLDLPEIKAIWVPLKNIRTNMIKIFPEYDYLKLIEE